MKFTTLLPILIVLAIIGCESSTETKVRKETTIATLIWDDPSVDGCGFFLKFDKDRYKPINEGFIYESLESPYPESVIIEFKYLNRKTKYICGFSGDQEEKAIELFSIKSIVMR